MSEAPIETAAPATVESAIRRPAFRLQQLLVLMAVMAVMLAVSGPRDIRGIEISPLVQAAFTASGIVYTLVASVAITIVLFGIWGRRHGRVFLNQPGHWLLLSIAAHQVLILVEIILISTVAGVQGIDMVEAWGQVPFGLTWLVPAAMLVVLNAYIGRRRCAEARWRRVFYANAAAQVVPVLGHMLVLISLERAVRAERSRRPLASSWERANGVQPRTGGQVVTPPRDFAHWYGVATTFFEAGFVILAVIGVVSYIIVPAFFY